MDAVENWQEVAVAVHDCVFYEWNGTAYYLGHVCQDGDFEIEYYTNENCTGTPFYSEDHWAQEGFCSEGKYCINAALYLLTMPTEWMMFCSAQ